MNVAFRNVGDADVSIDWTTPGGAGGIRTATVALGVYIGLFGPNPVRAGFAVQMPDDGNGRDDVLRLNAYRAIVPALTRFRLLAGRDPLSVATPDDSLAVIWTTVGMNVASEDGARRVFAKATFRARRDQSHEDRVHILAPAAWRFADGMLKDIQLLIGPPAV